jgi:hypothetical protein
MFKKDPVKYKQPQEYYCSNLYCFNESADNSPLRYLLTDEAYNNLSDFYCIDCIIEGLWKN